MQGAAARALAKRALSLASVSPRYLMARPVRQQETRPCVQPLVEFATTNINYNIDHDDDNIHDNNGDSDNNDSTTTNNNT